MTTIKSVEEQASYFRGAANIARAKIMLREDRATTLTALCEALEMSKQSLDDTMEGGSHINLLIKSQNQGIDIAIALIRTTLSGDASEKNV